MTDASCACSPSSTSSPTSAPCEWEQGMVVSRRYFEIGGDADGGEHVATQLDHEKPTSPSVD
jgi:hypothetical protein